MRFKTKVAIACLSLLSCTLVLSTIAWFGEGSAISLGVGNNDAVFVSSGAEAGYWAGGSGTETNPYIISNPKQLYNLAWLQYLGKFNTSVVMDENDEPVIDPDTGEPKLTQNISQKYFKIVLPTGKTSLDMSGITLPPIGTETYPFYGHFDGNGVIIENLTVSNDNPRNDESDFGVSKPAHIQKLALQPNVVGFFGVIGSLPNAGVSYDPDVNEVTNFVLKDILVQSRTESTLIGLAAGYVNGGMSQVTVDGDSDIKINKIKTIDENNNEVYVEPTAISGLSQMISEYGLVGHSVTPGTDGSYKQEISKYYNSDDTNTGSGEDWGGHVDLNSVYDRLYVLEQRAGNYSNYAYEVNRSSLKNGDVTTVQTVDYQLVRFRRYSHKQVEENSDEENAQSYIGNFSFGTNNGSKYSGDTINDEGKIYLEGGHYVHHYYYNYVDDSGCYIRDESHYLSFTETGSTGNYSISLGDVTAANACVWHIPSNGSTGYIYANYYSPNTLTTRQVYLSRSTSTTNPQLQIANSQSSAQTWSVSKETIGGEDRLVIVGNNSFRLVYYNGWTLRQYGYGDITTTNPDPIDYYRVFSSNYYMSNSVSNNNNVGRTNQQTSEVQLHVDSNGYVYATPTNSTTKHYLTLYQNSTTSYYVRWKNTTTLSGKYVALFVANTTTNSITCTYNNSTYYIYYNSSSPYWRSRTSATNAVSLIPVGHNILSLEYTLDNTIPKPFAELSSSYNPNPKGYMEFYDDDTSYFPINAYKQTSDDGVNKQYEPTAKNTGYFVSGTTRPTYSYGSTVDGRAFVVSKYNKVNKIGNSLDDGVIKDTIVRTVNSSGELVNVSDVHSSTNPYFHRYDDEYEDDGETVKEQGSKSKLQDVLNGSAATNVCGLHFVNQTPDRAYMVGTNNYVNATNVRVGGNNYSNYQLPTYSVDFNLSEQGYINFFAGTYNGGTGSHHGVTSEVGNGYINAFFSLHKVERNSDKTISIIKEIKDIYSKEGSKTYFYSYKDYNNPPTGKEYSVVYDGFDPTETDEDSNPIYTKIFDTDWIGYYDDLELQTADNLGHLFYFEIPIDKGEYCLGNVYHNSTQKVEGAYLIYLDIGASGNEDTDTILGYTITTHVSSISFPTGVDFAIASVDSNSNGGETVCIYIPSGTSGTINFVVAHNVADVGETIDITDSLSKSSVYSYISDDEGDTFELDLSSEDPPGDFVTPTNALSITRYSYICVISSNDNSKTYVTVMDTFVYNTDKNIYVIDKSQSAYLINGTSVSLAELHEAIPSLNDLTIDRIRALSLAVTLTKDPSINFVETFDASLPLLPWDVPTYYDITVDIPQGYKIIVTLNGSYTVVINGGNSITTSSTYTEPAP